MTFARATVVGAGLAGLSAAVCLRKAGMAVTICDSAPYPGGRCRSYYDPQLGRVIDNGNHLVLSGNRAVERFRTAIGAVAPLTGPREAAFAFRDLRDDSAWTVRFNDGRLPWWLLLRRRRVPGTRLRDYFPYRALLDARRDRIDQNIVRGPVWDKFLAPVLLAALNTDPAEGTPRLVANVLRETIQRGGRAMQPRIAAPTLAAAFVDPALAWLEAHQSPVGLGRRLQAISFAQDRVVSLDWGKGPEPVAPQEALILAVPPWIATSLVPDLSAPDEYRAILNAHFAFAPPAGTPAMLGLLGSTAEWLFAFPDRISVTISAADRLMERDRTELARTLWTEICAAYGIDAAMPAWQIVKEKRATFAATPAQDARRPPSHTRWRNLFLAGDWVQTDLPATIEGALRSGETAARLVAAARAG